MAGHLLPEEKELGIYEDDASSDSGGDDDDLLSENEGGAAHGGEKGDATHKKAATAAAAAVAAVAADAAGGGGGARPAPSATATADDAAAGGQARATQGDSARTQDAAESAAADMAGTRLSSRTTASDGGGGEKGDDRSRANVLVTAALELLHQRCVSVVKQKAPFYETTRSPLTSQRCVKYISVSQSQPLPMEPLKAWKGYNGNMYFEPISIKPARLGSVATAERRGGSDADRESPASVARTRVGKARTAPASRGGGASDPEAAAAAAALGSPPDLLFRQMSVLDKRAVMSRLNRHLHEDLAWIRGREAVGSLIEAATPGDKARERDKYRPERIRHGGHRRRRASRVPGAGRRRQRRKDR